MDGEERNDDDTTLVNDLLTLIMEKDVNTKWFRTLTNSVSTNDNFHALKSSYHFYLVPRLFKLLQECLVTHRWSDALKVMNPISMAPLNTSYTIWRAGMEILYTNPSGNMSLIGQLSNQLKVLSDVNGKEVVLEYFMYLLTQGQIVDAKKTIQKATGMQKSSKSKYIDSLLTGYEGLVWYVEWLTCKQKHEFQATQDGENPGLADVMGHINYEELMKLNANKAIACFQSLVDHPGVWDIFITKYVDLLEYMDDEDQANRVLVSYCKKNKDNPNAHIYLYKFQIRHGASEKQIIQTLSLLADKDPSNKLVLELCHLLKNSPQTIEYLFNFLDYPHLNESLQPWQLLSTCFENLNLRNSKSGLKVLHKCWDIRKDWWPDYVFNTDKISTMDKNLMTNRALVASVLLGTENMFTAAVLEVLGEKEKFGLQEKISHIT